MVGQLVRVKDNGLRPVRPSPLSLRQELDEMFNQVLSGEADCMTENPLVPTMDLSETEDAYLAKLDLPGVNPEEIEIQVNGNVLTVTGMRHEEEEEKGRNYHRTERRFGSFSRSVSLPCEVVDGKVMAQLEGGVLSIELPKAHMVKPRRIKVKSPPPLT